MSEVDSEFEKELAEE